ncbi:hypothetical protein CPC08DRAFT_703093 [Agrocybe pediades]|nr:hypothetical protein CPC08DRAFT_703093 [Agrocybe pediades]
MSGPYVYNPPTQTVEYRNSPYLAPFYHQPYSPFIPEISLSGSPYQAVGSLPPSPNPAASPLPGTAPFIPVPFPSTTDSLSPDPWNRTRRSSWNGGVVPPTPTFNTTYLQPPRYYHQRTRSDSGYSPFAAPATIWPDSPYVITTPEPVYQIHQFLNGENPRQDIIFDLSAPNFCPMRYFSENMTLPISAQDLDQPATHPPIYNMQIVCDRIPQWPITISWTQRAGHSTEPLPIKVGDVLVAIWQTMQRRISQSFWATLDPRQEYAVSKAYTKRCKANPWMEMTIMNQGVKQVDFLHGKVYFKGLLRTGSAGFGTMKLITA